MGDGSPPPPWYDPPSGHAEECNCRDCHLNHWAEGWWIDNALDHPKDFECCVNELEEQIELGNVCEKHPRSYCETAVDGDGKKAGFYCEGCDQEFKATSRG